ncbi:MAG: hypothetical protein NZ893_02660 [Candidatus Aenigmarchaeota archaeon]|nr:hypothetical protein [Candidatus Aenigmarchaeota archaeon]
MSRVMRVSDVFFTKIKGMEKVLESTYKRKFTTVEITEKVALALDLVIKKQNKTSFLDYEYNIRPIVLFLNSYKKGKKKSGLRLEKILDFTPDVTNLFK